MSIAFINLKDITLAYLYPILGRSDQSYMSYVQISTKSVNRKILVMVKHGCLHSVRNALILVCTKNSYWVSLKAETHGIQIFKVLKDLCCE